MKASSAGLCIPMLLLSAGLACAEPAVVSATNLNLRAGPGAQHPVIAVMPQGARVETVQCGPEWCRVRYRWSIGYAVVSHLDRTPGEESRAEVPPTSHVIVNDPSPDPAARVWRWKDPQWRDRHARKGQWLRRHSQR